MPTLLCADWKIVTRTGDHTTTEYFKGSLTRTDPSPSYTTVQDFDRRRQVNWRSELRQYQIVDWPSDLRPNASSPVIHIERSKVDTGERKTFLGRTVRHLISHLYNFLSTFSGTHFLQPRTFVARFGVQF
jgi:hypothetical protein